VSAYGSVGASASVCTCPGGAYQCPVVVVGRRSPADETIIVGTSGTGLLCFFHVSVCACVTMPTAKFILPVYVHMFCVYWHVSAVCHPPQLLQIGVYRCFVFGIPC